MSRHRRRRGRHRPTSPAGRTGGRQRPVAGVAALIAVGLVLFGLSMTEPEQLVGAGATSAAPIDPFSVVVGSVSLDGDWNTTLNRTSAWISELGTTSGYAVRGQETPLCAHVRGPDGADAEDVGVVFRTTEGHVDPSWTRTGPDGVACVDLHVTSRSRSAIVFAGIRGDDDDSKTVRNSVVVVGGGSSVPGGAATWLVATGLLLVASAMGLWRWPRAFGRKTSDGRSGDRPDVAPSPWFPTVAVLSLAAAVIHAAAVPEHLGESLVIGSFLMGVAAAQALYAVLIVRWRSHRILAVGLIGNGGLIGLWYMTRTVGLPTWPILAPLAGDHAGVVEAIGLLDLGAQVLQGALVTVLAGLFVGSRRWTGPAPQEGPVAKRMSPSEGPTSRRNTGGPDISDTRTAGGLPVPTKVLPHSRAAPAHRHPGWGPSLRGPTALFARCGPPASRRPLSMSAGAASLPSAAQRPP